MTQISLSQYTAQSINASKMMRDIIETVVSDAKAKGLDVEFCMDEIIISERKNDETKPN